MLRERCQWIMRPKENIAIDEALILWKGTLSFRQFIETKRSRKKKSTFAVPYRYNSEWLFLEFQDILWEKPI